MRTIRLIQFVAVIAALSLFSSCKNKTWHPNPPYPGLEVKMTSYTLDAGKDTVLTLSNGTSLSIRANTMLTEDDKPIAGSYELLYREFHDAVDILLAGIPMEFKSMGQSRTMQTAGMFELDALQNGKKLKINEGENIGVRFASRNSGSNYNFFFMNPDEGQWEWVDAPEVEDNVMKQEAQKALDAKAPKIFLGDNYFVINYNRFLDIYLNDDYEKIYDGKTSKALRKKLEGYKFKIYNAVVEGELVFLKAYYHPAEMLWKDIEGTKFPSWTENFEYDWQKDAKGQWHISNFSFTSLGNNIYSVFYKSGKKSFSKKMEAVMPLKSIFKYSADQWQKQYDEAIATLKAEQDKIDFMAETYRSFSINRLGVYNFDCLLKGLDEWTKVDASYTVSNQPAKDGNVVIILADNSGYINISPKEYHSMHINPKSGHRILMLMADQQLGIFPADKLTSINIDSLKAIKNPSYTFDFEVKKVTDAIAFREMLGFK
jgi:hypothetical protein